jgi:hypothetical protein
MSSQILQGQGVFKGGWQQSANPWQIFGKSREFVIK